jgi:CHAT domain-containing protein/Tfp pilus assembly protein PilF
MMKRSAVLLAALAFGAGVPASAQEASPGAVAAGLLAATGAERARQLGALPGDLAPVTVALLSIGDEARAGADFPRAVAAYDAAGALARRAGADALLGRALVGESDGWFRQGQLDRAVARAEDAVVLYGALDDVGGQAQAWNAIGNVRWTQGRMQDAREVYERALPLFIEVGDRLGQARVHNNLGEVSRNTGASDAALDHFGQALAVFEELGDTRRAAVVIDNIGIVYFWRGEYVVALENARRALAMREAAGDRYGVAKSLDTLGNVYLAQGAYARALDCFHRSLPMRKAVRDYHGYVETSHNLGLVYHAQGDYARAIEAFRRGLRLNAQLRDASLESEALRNIGAAAWLLGERARAEANLRAALRIAQREDLGFMTARILEDLGQIARMRGRTREAQGLFERAVAAAERVKDRETLAVALTSLGAVALAEGHFPEAAGLADRAAAIARAYDQPEGLWPALTVGGVAARRQGRADEAQRALEEAVAVVEGLRRQVGGSDAGGARFLEQRLSPYHELIALAIERGGPAEALATAERAKARVLADLVHRGRPDPSRAMTAAERADERRLRGALLGQNERLQRERAQDEPDAARLAVLEAERSAGRRAYEAFQDAVQAAHPELRRERALLPPFTFADADRLLPDAETALVEYVVTDAGVHVFVAVRENGRPSVTSHTAAIGAGALADLVDRFRGSIAARTLAFREEGRRLYGLLVAPLGARLAGRTRLVLVPDGALWDLPFQALQDADGRYLVESASIAYAPSLTVLREIGRRPAAGAPSLLALGKAAFPNASGLAPLPEAEAQVRRIAALYGPGRAEVYFGDDAREDRFKAHAARHSVIHLASHGVLDRASPLYSHVVLAPGASDDGLLEGWELMDLRLDAEVVVLSACDTGRGRIAAGEGVVGTQWALFVAGARAMVVSQWAVEAAATAELMAALHRGLASGAGARADHLRAASLSVLRRPGYAHPFYWAGFVLVGDPS